MSLVHLPHANYHLAADRGVALITTRDGRRRPVEPLDQHLVPSPRARDYQAWLAGLEAIEDALRQAGKPVTAYQIALGGSRDLLAHLDQPAPNDFTDKLAADFGDGPLAPPALRDRLRERLGRWGTWGSLHDQADQTALELLVNTALHWPTPLYTVYPAPGAHYSLDGILACLDDGTDDQISAMLAGLRTVSRCLPRSPFLRDPALGDALERTKARGESNAWPLAGFAEEPPLSRSEIVALIARPPE